VIIQRIHNIQKIQRI